MNERSKVVLYSNAYAKLKSIREIHPHHFGVWRLVAAFLASSRTSNLAQTILLTIDP